MDLILEFHVKKLKSGDRRAFDDIYQMTHRKIYFVALSILKDRALAEDIVQDTYLKYLDKLYQYTQKNTLSYLLTIARNLALNEYNRRKREIRDLDLDAPAFSYDQFIEITAERKELIQKALGMLNETERNIFLLHVLEKMTHREIAMILDKPLGTITWTYQQAIRKMKRHLEGEKP